MDLERYVSKIKSFVPLLVVFVCLSLFPPMELLGFTQKKSQKELELKLKIPPVIINWKSSMKIIGARKELVPPTHIKFSFDDFFTNKP